MTSRREATGWRWCTLTAVRRHFKAIFEQELDSWYTDPDLWPKDLSYRAFKKFFTVQVSTMVIDLGKGMIIREED